MLVVASNLVARAAVPSVLGVVGAVGVVTLLVGVVALAARRVGILTTTDGGVVRSGAGVRPARVEVGRSTALHVRGDVCTSLVGHVHVAGPASRRTLLVCTRLIGHGSSLSFDAPLDGNPTSTLPVLAAPKPSRPKALRREVPSLPSWSAGQRFGARIPNAVNVWGFCYSDISDISPNVSHSDSASAQQSTVADRGPLTSPPAPPSASSPALPLADAGRGTRAAPVAPAVMARILTSLGARHQKRRR